MTICIASITSDSEIVAVSDHMLSFQGGTFTADNAALKESSLTAEWFALYASDKVGFVPGLLRRIEKSLGWRAVVDVEQMTNVVREAFQQERIFRAEEEYLKPNSLTIDALYHPDTIAARGENVVAILRDRVEQYELKTDLLVCGYGRIGDTRVPHVLHAFDPGIVVDYEWPGYWAIGKGSTLAMSWLAARGHNRNKPLATTVYHLCEAKFTGEGASDVGKETFVEIHTPDLRWKSLEGKAPTLVALRKAWEEHGRPPLDKETLIETHKWCKDDNWRTRGGEVVMPSADQTSDLSSSQVAAIPERTGQ